MCFPYFWSFRVASIIIDLLTSQTKPWFWTGFIHFGAPFREGSRHWNGITNEAWQILKVVPRFL